MKKEEFVTQLEEIIKDPSDLVKVSNFRDAVCADYDAHTVLETSSTNLQERCNTLEADNKKLKEVNLQLFMLSPAMSAQGKTSTTPTPEPDVPSVDNPEPSAPSLDDIVTGLLGKK